MYTLYVCVYVDGEHRSVCTLTLPRDSAEAELNRRQPRGDPRDLDDQEARQLMAGDR